MFGASEWGEIVDECVVGAGQIAQISCVPAVMKNLVTVAVVLAGIVALIFVLVAGAKLVLSGGDAKKVASARQTLTYAILGLVLVFFSFFIIALISLITGVDCIKFIGFTNCQH